MKLLALTFLIIGNLVANQAHADDVSTQPLTRVDCDKAAMARNTNANVCVANSGDVSGQPLTRLDCDKAGMSWNDDANVCGLASQEAGTTPKSEAADTLGQPTNPVASTVLIHIDKTAQNMTVFLDGGKRYHWPVSTGRAGYSTPSGNFTPTSMNEVWYSKQWDNSPMPHSIFFMKDGHAIHGSYEVKHLGKPVSHGCVRISPRNAVTLYALVGKNGLENTQVVLTGATPGGESKVASSARPRVKVRRAATGTTPAGPRVMVRRVQTGTSPATITQPQRRRGFFGHLFGGPYYNGPQAYYRPPPTYYPPRGSN